jgi:hypothetical protein
LGARLRAVLTPCAVQHKAASQSRIKLVNDH